MEAFLVLYLAESSKCIFDPNAMQNKYLQKVNQFEEASHLKSLFTAQGILHPHVECSPIPESDPLLSSSWLLYHGAFY